MKTLKLIYLSSLHVALATGVCAAAFFRLNQGQIDPISLAQIMLGCWMVYILDRILDVQRDDVDTERHQFHLENQYNLQVLAVALSVINGFLLFFQEKAVLILGAVLGITSVFYLFWLVPRFPKLKDYTMPMIYVGAVVGVPFVLAPSITLSSWAIAIVFLFVVYQNLTTFAYFETRNPVRRRIVTIIGSFSLFIYIFLFSGNTAYPNLLALLFALISIANSFVIANEKRFEKHYRWILDVLLFLPLIILF
jgi:hypothetical protein